MRDSALTRQDIAAVAQTAEARLLRRAARARRAAFADARRPSRCIMLAIALMRLLNPMTRHPELPERDRRILGGLVRDYIDHGRAGLLAVAGQPRLRRVVRDGPQHPGAARRAGLRPAAAHLGRPRPDRLGYRFYVDLLLGRAPRPRGRRRVEARLRRAGTRRGRAVARVAGGLAGVASGRLRDRAGDRGDVRAPRVRAARRGARSWSSSSRAAGTLAEGDRAERAARADELQQAANYLNTEFTGLPLSDVRAGGARAAAAKSGRSTTS